MKKTERLQSDVVDELAFDPKVDSSEIAVTATAQGVVTLKGTVRSYAEKRAAEAAAKRVAGLKGVANDIEVRPTTENARDDTSIAEAAVRALKWDVSVPEDRLKVSVSRAWVTLEGDVKSRFQKAAAARAVRDLLGVRGIVNNIEVKPTVSGADVRGKIEKAFKRSAQIDADRITVETEGGTVTLRGRVHSWAELDEAEDAAWAVPGVMDVENLLELEEPVYA